MKPEELMEEARTSLGAYGVTLSPIGVAILEWEALRNTRPAPLTWRELALLAALQDLDARVKRLEAQARAYVPRDIEEPNR